MRIFHTGSTGFIGRALALRLQRDGHSIVAWVRDEKRAASRIDAVVAVDLDGRIIIANVRTAEMFGYTSEELLAMDVGTLILGQLISSPEAPPTSGPIELVGRRKDGSEFLAEVSFEPARSTQGLLATAIIRDIKDRKPADQALRQSEARLRALTEAVPDMMFRITRDGTYIDFEPASGMDPLIPPSRFLGRRIDQTLPPEVARRAMLEVERAIETRDPRAFEYALEMDGDERSYEARIVAAGDDDLVCLVRDITERRRADMELLDTTRQLAHRVAELETLFDVVPVGVAIADDPACRHIRPNRELARMLRLAPGANASSTAPVDEQPTHFTMTRNGAPIQDEEQPMQVSARTGQPVLRSQMDVVFDDGSITSIYGQATPLFDTNGNVRGAIGAFLDITDVRRIEDELRQANAVKDEFLGLVSHELKTPITTILGNAEVLRKRGALLDEADRVIALTDIEGEATRLQNIIDNMLVLARLETAQGIELEPVLIHRLVARVADRHRRRNPHRTLHVRYDDVLPPTIGSSMYIEQILDNLLSNAEKYSSMQLPIDIDVARKGARVVVKVSDRGVGIPPNDLARVFTPFYRSPGAASHAQGFGIGLAVCKRLIEVQHGRISAEACPGGGTCFWFELPLAGDESHES